MNVPPAHSEAGASVSDHKEDEVRTTTLWVLAAACSVVLAVPAGAGATVNKATTAELLLFGATRGCEAGQAPPCVTVDTVDYDYDGVRTELEVCVSGPNGSGCAQVPLSTLRVEQGGRAASATVPVTLLTFRDDGTVSARLASVGIAFQAGNGPLDNRKTVSSGTNTAGCRFRYTTVAKLRSGTLRATLDGASHTGAAQLGTYTITDRTSVC